MASRSAVLLTVRSVPEYVWVYVDMPLGLTTGVFSTMAIIARFGFEGSDKTQVYPQVKGTPSLVNVDGGFEDYEAIAVFSKPNGTIDSLYVLDLSNKEKATRVATHFRDVSSDMYVEYDTCASTRVGIATVGMENGSAYLNFYGWTSLSDAQDPQQQGYYLRDINHRSGATTLEKIWDTVLYEIELYGGVELSASTEWINDVLQPFMYGKFDTQFRMYGTSSSVPPVSVVPDPPSPRFYVNRASNMISGDHEYTQYHPYYANTGVIWGYRFDKNNSSYGVINSKYIEKLVDWFSGLNTLYSNICFIPTRNSGYVFTENETINGVYPPAFRTSIWSDGTFSSSYSFRKHGISTLLNSCIYGEAYAYSVAASFMTFRAARGNCSFVVPEMDSIHVRMHVGNFTDNDHNAMYGTYRLFYSNGIKVNYTFEAYRESYLRINYNGIEVSNVLLPNIVTASVYVFDISITASGNVTASFDGYTASSNNVCPGKVWSAFTVGGLPHVDNVTVATEDPRYNQRYDTRYENPQDFNSENDFDDTINVGYSTGIDPIKNASDLVSLNGGATTLRSRAVQLYSINSTTTYPVQHLKGASIQYKLGKSGYAQALPTEVSVQLGNLKRPVLRTIQNSNTDISGTGYVLYDSQASDLYRYKIGDLITRFETDAEPVEGLTYYVYNSSDFVQPYDYDGSLLTKSGVGSLSTILSELSGLTGVCIIKGYAYLKRQETYTVSVHGTTAHEFVLCNGSHRVGEEFQFSGYLPIQVYVQLDGGDVDISVSVTRGGAPFDAPWYTDNSPEYLPENHGWINVIDLSVGTQIGDLTVNEGSTVTFTLPNDAFVGESRVSDYTLELMSHETSSELEDPLSWIAFDRTSGGFVGTPLNVNVGSYVVKLTANTDTGGSVYQAFKITVVNVNTPPYLVSAIPDIIVDEDSSYSISVSPYFSDLDVANGDKLSYEAYIQRSSNNKSYITSEWKVSIICDNSGKLYSTAATLRNMISEGGRLRNSLERYYGGSFDSHVTFSYGDSSWLDGFDINDKNIIIYCTDSTSYADSEVSAKFSALTSIASGKECLLVYLFPPAAGSLVDQLVGTTTNVGLPYWRSSTGFRYNAVYGFDYDGDSSLYYSYIVNALSALGMLITQPYSAIPQWSSIHGGTLTFNPGYDDLGSYQFVARVTDSSGSTADGSFKVTVRPINHSPVVVNPIPDSVCVRKLNYTDAINLGNVFTDIDLPRGDTLTFEFDGLPQWLTWNESLGILSGTVPDDASDSYEITVTATDSGGLSTSDTFTLAVAADPIVSEILGPYSLAYTDNLTVDTGIVSYDGGDLEYSYSWRIDGVDVVVPSWIIRNATSLTFNPGVAQVDSVITVTVTATAPNGAYASFDVVVNVYDTVPVLTSGIDVIGISYIETRTVDLDEHFYDAEGLDTLSYSVETEGSSWITITGSTLRFSPSSADIGTTEYVVRATDAAGKIAECASSIIVTNAAPTITTQNAQVEVNGNLDIGVTAIDPEGGDVTLSFEYAKDGSIVVPWFGYNEETRRFTGTPSESDVGIITVTVIAIDVIGSSSTSSFTVEAYATPKVLTVPSDLLCYYNQTYTVDLSGTFGFSTDGGTVSVFGLPGWMSWNAETQTLTLTPPSSSVNTLTVITLVGTDDASAGGREAVTTFTVTVQNHAPLVNKLVQDVSYSYTYGNFSFSVAEAFVDQDEGGTASLTLSLVGPSWITLNSSTLVVSGITEITRIGSYDLTLSATDRFGSKVSQTFTLSITNRAPFVNRTIDSFSMGYGTIRAVDLSNVFSDYDDPSGITVTVSESNWTNLDESTMVLTLAPTLANVGDSTFTLKATDTVGESTTTSFTVTVTNSAPQVVTPLVDQDVLARTSWSYNISGVFTDPDVGSDEQLTYSYTVTLDGVQKTLSWLRWSRETCTFSGIPSNVTLDTYVVSVTVTDGIASATASFDLTVYDVPDQPPELYAQLVDQSLVEESGWTYSFNGCFRDPDSSGGDLEYSTSWKSSEGTSIEAPSWVSFDPNNLSFTGVPPLGSVGTAYSVTVTCTDTYGRSVSDTFTVTVRGIPLLSCGSYYRESSIEGYSTGANQTFVCRIYLGNVAGSVSLYFNAYTYYDSVRMTYRGEFVSFVDPYDHVSKTSVRIGMDNPDETYPASISKTLTWSGFTGEEDYVVLYIDQGPNSTDWRFIMTCPS